MCGDVMGVVACKKATDEDKRLANSFRVKPAANQRVAAFAKEPKRARAESWAGFSGYSSPIPPASSTPQYGGDTAGDPVNITGEEPSQAERDAVAEELEPSPLLKPHRDRAVSRRLRRASGAPPWPSPRPPASLSMMPRPSSSHGRASAASVG